MPASFIYSHVDASPKQENPGEYVLWLQERMLKSHEVARKHIGKMAQYSKEIYDAKLSFHRYQIGDVVWCLHETWKVGVNPKLEKRLRLSPSYNSGTLRDQLYHPAEQRRTNQSCKPQQAQALQRECSTEMGVIRTEENLQDLRTINQLIIIGHYILKIYEMFETNYICGQWTDKAVVRSVL
ncbi:hypothetical protein DPMN_005132 [Dreissena polymorpha]|uniref:Uncharacterized protein n=1 Tax=Dreissena polymorpha TaxID=45954 RepID=A0A9D4MSN0_DREPO|nr:hypothetical protein DPMN_005132 [Dreissena polymorpha]